VGTKVQPCMVYSYCCTDMSGEGWRISGREGDFCSQSPNKVVAALSTVGVLKWLAWLSSRLTTITVEWYLPMAVCFRFSRPNSFAWKPAVRAYYILSHAGSLSHAGFLETNRRIAEGRSGRHLCVVALEHTLVPRPFVKV